MAAKHYINSVTGHVNALLALRDLASNDNVISVTIAGGGTGYVVGDSLTVSGGTVVGGYTATLEVTSVNSGVIDGIRVENCGAYSAQPTNAVSVTGGTGSGATFNLTWETNNWVVDRDTGSPVNSLAWESLDHELMMHGVGNAGADEIYVGFQAISETNRGSDNWNIQGQTGFDSGSNFEDQPGSSWAGANTQRCYTPLTSAAIECWFYIAPRFIAGVFKMGTTYTNFIAGFLNPYATATEYPYPLYVSGCSTRFDALFGDSGFNLGGMHNPIARTGAGASSNGPATIRAPDGIWYSVHNIQFNGSTVTAVDGHNVHPTNSQINVNDSGSFPDPADRFVSGVLSYDLIIRNRDYQLEPSDTDVVVLTPTVVFSNAPDKGPVRWYGEIPDVYWFDVATTGITPEDRLIANGVYHRAFQNGNVTDNNYQFCIREDA